MGIEGLVETILMSKGNRNLFCFLYRPAGECESGVEIFNC